LRFLPVSVLFRPVIRQDGRRPNRDRADTFPVFIPWLAVKRQLPGCGRWPAFPVIYREKQAGLARAALAQERFER
jgi:hypothetical protein